MEDRAYTTTALGAQSAQAQAIKATPELGRLKFAAERVARAAANVEYFLARFHGPMAEQVTNGEGTSEDNYRNDLATLFATLDRLEVAVSALDHIG